MIRQTGGLAIGATSTRSRSSSRARRSASGTALIPSWSPSGPMRRTSRARMRSLIRCCSVALRRVLWLLTPVQWAASPLVGCRGCSTRSPPETTDPTPGWTRVERRAVGPGRTRSTWPGGGCRRAVAPLRARVVAARVAHVSRRIRRDDAARAGRRRRRRRRSTSGARRARRGPPAARRGAGRGRGHQPRDGPVRAGRDPPVGARRPTSPAAALAIDAVGCLVDGLGDRLGPRRATLRDALANIRLAFVQIKGAAATGRPRTAPTSADATDDAGPSRTVTPSAREQPRAARARGPGTRPTRREVDDAPPRQVDAGGRPGGEQAADEPRTGPGSRRPRRRRRS